MYVGVNHPGYKHGMVGPVYKVWGSMNERCGNPRHRFFHRYGGSGISVCARWQKDFPAFYADMGDPPPGMQLERTDNDKGYSPGNCRWATRVEQNSNRACRVTHEAFGVSMSSPEWARKTGIGLRAIKSFFFVKAKHPKGTFESYLRRHGVTI